MKLNPVLKYLRMLIITIYNTKVLTAQFFYNLETHKINCNNAIFMKKLYYDS